MTVSTNLKETIMQAIKNFINDEAGVTAIEYGLIASLIAVVIVVAVATIGTKLDTVFEFISGKIVTTG